MYVDSEDEAEFLEPNSIDETITIHESKEEDLCKPNDTQLLGHK